MSRELSVQLSGEQAEGGAAAVGQGRFESPDAAIQPQVGSRIGAAAGRSIAEAYRRAYTEYPQDPQLGEVGAQLMAEIVGADEQDTD